jgi:uncharacterized protein (DUF1501 family)
MSLTRRQVLGHAVALGSVLALPRLVRGEDEAPTSPRRTLVLLHLNGGNDGLNTVIPYQDPRYRVLRPSLAIDRGQVRKLTDGLGLHPALSGFEQLFQRKRLCIINGVGYPDPNYSHFRATEIWFTAQPERSPTDGWIGRALDAGTSKAPLRAVALLKEKPLSVEGNTPGVVTMTDFGRFRLPGGMDAAADLYRRYAQLDATPQNARRAAIGTAGEEALQVAKRIAALKPAGGSFYASLGSDLRKVMALLQADLGLECIQLQMGGYDTHSGQAGSHQRLLGQLGNNLNVFQREIEKAGLGEKVVTVVMSEFGRRATENLSGGTDHGSAGPVFVIGQGVTPDLLGAYPSLEDLDRENFKFTTDFRRIYAALLPHAFGVDPTPIVGDHKPLELFV